MSNLFSYNRARYAFAFLFSGEWIMSFVDCYEKGLDRKINKTLSVVTISTKSADKNFYFAVDNNMLYTWNFSTE